MYVFHLIQQVEDSTKEIVKKAAQAVGSLRDTEFDIRFNPDVYSPGVVHPESETADGYKKQCQLVKVCQPAKFPSNFYFGILFADFAPKKKTDLRNSGSSSFHNKLCYCLNFSI